MYDVSINKKNSNNTLLLQTDITVFSLWIHQCDFKYICYRCNYLHDIFVGENKNSEVFLGDANIMKLRSWSLVNACSHLHLNPLLFPLLLLLLLPFPTPHQLVLLLPRIWPAIILLYQIEASMIRKGRKIKEYEQRNKKLENSRRQHRPKQNRTEQNRTEQNSTDRKSVV